MDNNSKNLATGTIVSTDSVWITGYSRSGKTTRLVEKLGLLLQQQSQLTAVLALAAIGDNRIDLADRMVQVTEGRYPVHAKTPLGFFLDQVQLFWPLLIDRLQLPAQFAVRLRPETEQELATQLWRPELDSGILRMEGVSEYRLVRRTLDLLSLAAVSGTPLSDIPIILEQGLVDFPGTPGLWQSMGELLLRWRSWCLSRGFLTYGIVSELYWRHLLPDRTYQQYLTNRYRLLLADDVDEYPAIARMLFEFLLAEGAVGVFTYNPTGGIRQGLGADPLYMEDLASRCQVENLASEPVSGLAPQLSARCMELVGGGFAPAVTLPAVTVQSIQTTSRAQLLRQTAEAIIHGVQQDQVPPEEIAVILPGVDAIARYTLTEILTKAGIAIELLNDQRPLTASPLIRALLTLLALVYPGWGRLLDRDAVAEMLVVLSQEPIADSHPPLLAMTRIDPVRAGLLADYCYAPDPDRPRLLPVDSFPRWDRLGHRATQTYNQILEWIEIQQQQLLGRLVPSPIVFLDRAIQQFLWKGSNLPYDQIAAIRELMETAQHYWEVAARMKDSWYEQTKPGYHQIVGRFIQLLRQGTVTANPFPVRPIGPQSRAVTLTNIFQYRSTRRRHRWHFWIDASSPLWLKGGAATLFAAPLFLQDRLGRPWTSEDETEADEKRLPRILQDLLARVDDRLYLCHSDLATNGQDQTGPLLGLVNAAVPFSQENLSVQSFVD